MAKFNIEVELDWVDEENGYTIDEEIKEQAVRFFVYPWIVLVPVIHAEADITYEQHLLASCNTEIIAL